MSTEYQQVPSQQAFTTSSDVDPWLISATRNMNINWGGKSGKRNFSFSPPLLEAEIQWGYSPASTPPLYTTKRPALSPSSSQYISTASLLDPWAVTQAEDLDDVSSSSDGAVDDDDEGSQQDLYKTELCRSFLETGACRYGLKCQFAHGKHELRPVLRHPKYKTEICKTFHTLGTCPYGTRCRFIHTRPKGSGRSSPTSPSAYASPLSVSPLSRSPSPPAVVPNKWSTSWSRPRSMRNQEEVPEQETVESEVPQQEDPASASKKRLAVFRDFARSRE